MGRCNEAETSHEHRARRRLQVVYARRTRERQLFMQELNEIRKKKEKYLIKTIKKAIGPTWYQTLSVPQRNALDELEFSIYQDILEGRPARTAKLMTRLGLYPRPNAIDLMNCLYAGRNDPKQMLAQLFLTTYGHPIEGKQLCYSLNSRLMLSGILYLGLENLFSLLKKKFQPDVKEQPPQPKPKAEVHAPLASPYLQDMIAVLYLPPKRKPFQPAPLPNLDDLNEPYEDDPPVPKPPPPLPPPPPPKKRLPKSYCDKLAGTMRIEPYSSITGISVKRVTQITQKKLRKSKTCFTEVKKTYGIRMTLPKKGIRRRKPVAPSTGLWNAQYTINGVFVVNGKSVFVLGSVSILPPQGELIHGGFKYIGGDVINVHCGYRGRPPPPKPDPCDCVKQWKDAVFEYIKGNKCMCQHYYDYGNEGNFSSDEVPFFEKPTKFLPYKFNYDAIYDLDEKSRCIKKEFKRFWDTDSVLHVSDPNAKKTDKKKKKKRSSTTCLGEDPKPEDYLRCALRQMRRVNIASKLPDVHLVPELKEWMRRRIYGPFSRYQKKEMLRKSISYWQTFLTLALKGFGHVYPRKDSTYAGHTNWVYKQQLNDKFRKYIQQYRLELYRSYAHVNNLLWPTMYQAQFPDKRFREIYFSYLFGRIEDLQLMHPYSSRETLERMSAIAKKRYVCPLGVDMPD